MRAAREAACLSAARVYPGLPEQQNNKTGKMPQANSNVIRSRRMRLPRDPWSRRDGEVGG